MPFSIVSHVGFGGGERVYIQLAKVHERMDRVLQQFNGLRRYLYEIDPQFDDERYAMADFLTADAKNQNFGAAFAAMNEIDLRKTKKKQGKRTLDTPFDEI